MLDWAEAEEVKDLHMWAEELMSMTRIDLTKPFLKRMQNMRDYKHKVYAWKSKDNLGSLSRKCLRVKLKCKLWFKDKQYHIP